jgi:hypothetical protein
MLLSKKIGAKYFIPKGRAHTVSFVRILVMMEHVVLFDLFPKAAFKIEMVYGIMRYVIYKIAQYKAGEKPPDIIYR